MMLQKMFQLTKSVFDLLKSKSTPSYGKTIGLWRFSSTVIKTVASGVVTFHTVTSIVVLVKENIWKNRNKY